MPRTTAAAVEGIIETDITVPSLDPFIEASNALVTELCEPVTTYDAVRLELIERWLAAHFYAIRDMRRLSETVGPVSEWYQYKLSLGLGCTMYGQQAMLLDTAGGLARLSHQMTNGGPIPMSITHLGSCEDDD